MLALAITFKIALILTVLTGAGLALARATLLRGDHTFGSVLTGTQRTGLLLAAAFALASFVLLVLRLGAGLDMSIVTMIAQSSSGYAVGLIVAGAVIGAMRAVAAVGALLIVAAFAITGHAAAESTWDGVIIGFHVGAGAWWTGGLILLAATLGRPNQTSQALDLLDRFSRQAIGIVIVLLLAGGWVVLELLGISITAISTGYGLTLLLKIAFAAGALSVALYNRVRLAPAILTDAPGARERLRKNVLIELTCIAVVAIATGVLTSATSPPMMSS